MAEVVYAKVRSRGSKIDIYYVGPSLDAIKRNLLKQDDPSKLEEVSEEEVKKLQFFYEAKSAAELGEVYSIGTRNCINYNRYRYLFSIFICNRN